MEVGLYENGEVEVTLVNGNIVLTYGGKGMTGNITLNGDYFMDKVKEVIPGGIDDTIIDILKAALKA